MALLVALSAPAAATPVRRSFTLAAAGDVLIHSRLADLAARNADQPGEWDFWPMLEPIAPWVSSADFAICHLESVLSRDNDNLSYYPRYIAPHQVADALVRAGWDACSVASNHALDGGLAGIASTLDHLDERGIGHSGTARTEEERLPALYEVGGVKIAHLSFSQHFNGLEPPAGRAWAANRIEVGAIVADAAWARRHGAEFVIVSLHWGVEYLTNPIEYQTSLARDLLAEPSIDLILGHHPHVVEPIGEFGGKYVAYSMGNHISNQHTDWGPKYFATNEGQLLVFHVGEGDDGLFRVNRIEVVPTWVRLSDLHVFAAQDAIRRGIEPGPVLEAAISRTMERTLRLGAPSVAIARYPWAPGGQYERNRQAAIRLPAGLP